MFVLAGYDEPSAAIQDAQNRPNGMKNLLTRIARTSTDHARRCWKEIGSVEIVLSPNGPQIDAAVKDAYNEYSFAQRSEGFKRFISFLLLVSARARSKDLPQVLFIQDEPDLGLHPTGVKSLLQELIRLSDENYVLTSTHSIFLIDKERVDRHLIITKERETTVVSTVDRSRIIDEEVLFNALGYSLFELVRPENIVFEGWRDKKLFLTYCASKRPFAKSLAKKVGSEIGLVHAMGVKDIPKVLSYFDAIHRECRVVTDSDRVAVEKKLAIAQERPDLQWHTYADLMGTEGSYTAEDFIKSKFLASCLQMVLAEAGYAAATSHGLFETPGRSAVPSADLHVAGFVDNVESRKEILNTWKSKIFDNLPVAEIDETYDQVVAGIAELLGAEP
jgi:hypothetical protein